MFVVCAAILGLFYWTNRRAELNLVKSNQFDFLATHTEIIDADFLSVAADVRILSASSSLKSFLEEPSPAARHLLEQELQRLILEKPAYDQVRYLDESGRERIRVHRVKDHVVIVPDEHLQSKVDRYYFTGTMQLRAEEIFLSFFDLNVEEGVVEEPRKPTIRFSTPVFDSRQTKRGIVIVNYLGQTLIDKLLLANVGSVGQIYLANSRGYWLMGPTPKDEFTFMYPTRKQVTVASTFPNIWERIAVTLSGQIEDDQGIFTFATITPADKIQERVGFIPELDQSSTDSNSHERWKFVSHVPTATLEARSRPMRMGLLKLQAMLSSLLAVASWFATRAIVQNQQANLALLASERLAAIGEAMAALTHESRNALQRSQAGLEMIARRVQHVPEVPELLAEVRSAQDFLYSLYEQVRGYAAPLSLQRTRTDVRSVLQQTWNELSTEPLRQHATLQEELGTDALQCDANPAALGQVFRNILENALQMGKPPILINVKWSETTLNSRPALCVTFTDNGPGMSEEQRQRIFEPFFTTRPRGAGLGMAISKRIIDAHQGEIRAVESSGSGASIQVVLLRSSS